MKAYEQIKVLGEGGFAKAFLVKRKTDRLLCVAKSVKLSGLSEKEKKEAISEVNVLSALKHPNIVRYIESFNESGFLYIIMEYADGGDLSQKIEKNGRKSFSEDEVLRIFTQLALAIKYIHDRKILHRDLKGQNVFLMKDGSVKLGDFGIAKVLDHTMQFYNTQIGTPYYLSPEMCQGKNYNSKTDIWSFGCIMYEMCTLHHAFEGRNINNLLFNIVRGNITPISTQYSADLRNLINSMLSKDPKLRPTATEIVKKPIIRNRLTTYLSEFQVNNEMSHTVLHGMNPLKQNLNFEEPMKAIPETPVDKPDIRQQEKELELLKQKEKERERLREEEEKRMKQYKEIEEKERLREERRNKPMTEIAKARQEDSRQAALDREEKYRQKMAKFANKNQNQNQNYGNRYVNDPQPKSPYNVNPSPRYDNQTQINKNQQNVYANKYDKPSPSYENQNNKKASPVSEQPVKSPAYRQFPLRSPAQEKVNDNQQQNRHYSPEAQVYNAVNRPLNSEERRRLELIKAQEENARMAQEKRSREEQEKLRELELEREAEIQREQIYQRQQRKYHPVEKPINKYDPIEEQRKKLEQEKAEEERKRKERIEYEKEKNRMRKDYENKERQKQIELAKAQEQARQAWIEAQEEAKRLKKEANEKKRKEAEEYQKKIELEKQQREKEKLLRQQSEKEQEAKYYQMQLQYEEEKENKARQLREQKQKEIAERQEQQERLRKQIEEKERIKREEDNQRILRKQEEENERIKLLLKKQKEENERFEREQEERRQMKIKRRKEEILEKENQINVKFYNDNENNNENYNKNYNERRNKIQSDDSDRKRLYQDEHERLRREEDERMKRQRIEDRQQEESHRIMNQIQKLQDLQKLPIQMHSDPDSAPSRYRKPQIAIGLKPKVSQLSVDKNQRHSKIKDSFYEDFNERKPSWAKERIKSEAELLQRQIEEKRIRQIGGNDINIEDVRQFQQQRAQEIEQSYLDGLNADKQIDNGDFNDSGPSKFYDGDREVDLPVANDNDSMLRRADRIKRMIINKIGEDKFVKLRKEMLDESPPSVIHHTDIVSQMLMQQLICLEDNIPR
ncbi:CAMK family protein kinase [Trichomonas vaginalis G3]|uniref:non-specific serine/threonine protein kinase n=1 Tax=Trichomonas vaginalis (strain ATCC PRA-98 / G3) TaxID=412133 RepID=A2DVU2_TRIV3|nr:CAMK family protein kinase [Trichomonas vaginalis G3]|eukprot:XP_001327728.1 CAMK family protein kinase [Trichomonas vaginalis G3]